MDKQDQQFREIMKNYRPRKAPVDFSKRVMDEIHSLLGIDPNKADFLANGFLPFVTAVLVVFVSVTFLLWGRNRSEIR